MKLFAYFVKVLSALYNAITSALLGDQIIRSVLWPKYTFNTKEATWIRFISSIRLFYLKNYQAENAKVMSDWFLELRMVPHKQILKTTEAKTKAKKHQEISRIYWNRLN